MKIIKAVPADWYCQYSFANSFATVSPRILQRLRPLFAITNDMVLMSDTNYLYFTFTAKYFYISYTVHIMDIHHEFIIGGENNAI